MQGSRQSPKQVYATRGPKHDDSRACEPSQIVVHCKEDRGPPSNTKNSLSYGAAQYRGDRSEKWHEQRHLLRDDIDISQLHECNIKKTNRYGESNSANISKSAHNNFFNKCKMSQDLNISVHTKVDENSLHASKANGGFRFQYHVQSKEYTQMEENDSSLSPSFSRSDRCIAAISLCSSTSEHSIEIASPYSFSDEAEETKLVEIDKLHSLPEDSVALEDASSYSSKSGASSKGSRKRHSECISKNPTSNPFLTSKSPPRPKLENTLNRSLQIFKFLFRQNRIHSILAPFPLLTT